MRAIGRHRQLPDTELRRRRILVRRTATGAVLAVGCATVLVSGGSSEAAGAEQVAQAVTIDVGSDGSLTTVTGTDIRKDLPGFTSTTTTYAPRDAASKLPLTLSLSYLKDGVPGTDLAQLKGAKGRVEVDVTVTNTTVKAQPVTYSVNGKQVTQQSLVGTPLTVTASASLPKGSFARIVQPSAGVAEAHTTNGAISGNSDGSSTISWAALLAPPQLAPTTTFAIVEDATDFHLPTFSISAQPGLVADPSASALIDRTFTSSDAVSTQNQAIALITQINGQLSEVSQTLGTIRASLDGTATDLASSASSTLEQAGSEVAGAAQSLGGELQALQSTVGGSVQTSGDTTTTALNTTVAGLVKYLGVPPGTDSPAAVIQRALSPRTATTTPPTATSPAKGTCGAQPDPGATPTTVYAQLKQVADLTTQIAANGSACLTATRAQLLALLGSDQPVSVTQTDGTVVQRPFCSVDANAATLACTLLAAQDKVGTDAITIVGDADTKGAIRSTADGLEGIASGNVALTRSVAVGLRSQSNTILADVAQLLATDPLTSPGSLTDARDALAATISDLQGVAGDASTLGDDLNGLAGTATAQGKIVGLADVSHGAPAKSIQAEITSAVSLLCAGNSDLDPLSNVNRASRLLTGYTCPATILGVTTPPVLLPPLTFDGQDVTTRLEQDVTAWNSLASDLTEKAGTAHGLGNQIGSAINADGGLKDDLTALTALLGPVNADHTIADGSPAATFNARLLTAKQSVAALFGVDSDSCPVAKGPVTATYAALLDCLTHSAGTITSGIQASLDALNTQVSGQYDEFDQQLGTASDQTGAAGDQAKSDFGDLLGTLQKQLDDTANAEFAQGVASLVAQQKTLLAAQTKAGTQIGAATTGALATLDAAVTAANTNQGAVSQQLAQEIALVETNIGGSTGEGILGTVQDSVGKAASGSQTIDAATDDATGFKGVRLAAVSQTLLQAAQGQAAQQLAQAYPAFGVTLPQGSTHSTVFVFDLAPIG